MSPFEKKIIVVCVFAFSAGLLHAQSEPKPESPVPTISREDMTANPDTVMMIVESMPVFRNDPDGTAKYLARHIVYPETARELNIQGTVFASFIVRKDGSVSDVRILRSVHPLLDEEVLRVLRSMPPEWKPGQQNGNHVNVQLNVPVKFKLDDPMPIPFSGKKKKGKKRPN